MPSGHLRFYNMKIGSKKHAYKDFFSFLQKITFLKKNVAVTERKIKNKISEGNLTNVIYGSFILKLCYYFIKFTVIAEITYKIWDFFQCTYVKESNNMEIKKTIEQQ